MSHRTEKDLKEFHALYLHYYGKYLTLEETEQRLDALVRLLKLVRDVKLTPEQKKGINEREKELGL